MIEAIGFALVLLAGVVVAIQQRRQAATQPGPLKPTGRVSNINRYNQAGYRFSRENAEDLIDAAALAEQRKSGRHLGPDTHVFINLGCKGIATDFETVNHARWLEKFGASNGVYLHAMDGDREMSAAEKNKILYRGHR